jgi:hypothetical protein
MYFMNIKAIRSKGNAWRYDQLENGYPANAAPESDPGETVFSALEIIFYALLPLTGVRKRVAENKL